MFVWNLFIKIIYQPFFNLLVALYNSMDFLFPGKADMGICVIIFTVIFRLILLPVSLTSDRSEKDKHALAEKMKEIRAKYKNQPIILKEEMKKLFKSNRRLVGLEVFDIALQVMIILMLWRIFAYGLEGADMHLLYPQIKEPKHINMMFLGKFDLSRPNQKLNLINSFALFAVETLNVYITPFKLTKIELLTPIILPIGVYFYMYTMPAGKKLFMISTLCITFCIIVYKKVSYWIWRIREKLGYNKNTENR